jgi:hypothetical protein
MQTLILSTIEKAEKVSSTKKGRGRRESWRGREGGKEGVTGGGSPVRRISISPVVESSY